MKLSLFGRKTASGRWLFKDEHGEEYCSHGVPAKQGCYTCAADLWPSKPPTSRPSGGDVKRPHVGARKHTGINWNRSEDA